MGKKRASGHRARGYRVSGMAVMDPQGDYVTLCMSEEAATRIATGLDQRDAFEKALGEILSAVEQTGKRSADGLAQVAGIARDAFGLENRGGESTRRAGR